MTEVPDFSGFAPAYSASRPGYPPELFAWLASVVSRHDLAWDTATGSGQAAVGLADHFDRVIATDRSQAQILHARRHPRVEYRVARAEASGLPTGSVDLTVAAAAVHWFDLEEFYREARRVGRDGGVIAVWTYHVAHLEPPAGDVLGRFYRDVVRPYFAPGARLVDDRYQAIELPGQRLQTPSFVMSATWTVPEILDFVRTWSGVQSYIEKTGEDPVAELASQIQGVCPPDSAHELRWPLYLKASRL